MYPLTNSSFSVIIYHIQNRSAEVKPTKISNLANYKSKSSRCSYFFLCLIAGSDGVSSGLALRNVGSRLTPFLFRSNRYWHYPVRSKLSVTPIF